MGVGKSRLRTSVTGSAGGPVIPFRVRADGSSALVQDGWAGCLATLSAPVRHTKAATVRFDHMRFLGQCGGCRKVERVDSHPPSRDLHPYLHPWVQV
ncbi:hypothetical protein [Streptomyces sp. NPDC101455]|uniref:hypothetical protein n=1 Tax=Streptomyces sp. NPDC101455 TaxID=3366142 RepID=UPI003817CF2A